MTSTCICLYSTTSWLNKPLTVMQLRTKLVLAMVAAAVGMGGILYLITGNMRLSAAVAGLMLLTDLHFVPKMLPHIFGRDRKPPKE